MTKLERLEKQTRDLGPYADQFTIKKSDSLWKKIQAERFRLGLPVDTPIFPPTKNQRGA